jgi:hypothetical protein
MEKNMKKGTMRIVRCVAVIFVIVLSGCAGRTLDVWHDKEMDFGSVKTIAVLPFANLSQVQQAGQRVRDTLMVRLMATGGVYVLPPGEVARGIARAGLADPAAPSQEEAAKFCNIIKADAVITGVVREYGEVRSGSAIGSIIVVSMDMLEGQTGRVVWTASSEVGGISLKDRLLGPSGKPMNVSTEQAIDDIIEKLFR